MIVPYYLFNSVLEALKIDGGTPRVRTHLGWLMIFHGVDGTLTPGADHQRNVRYNGGVLIVDRTDSAYGAV